MFEHIIKSIGILYWILSGIALLFLIVYYRHRRRIDFAFVVPLLLVCLGGVWRGIYQAQSSRYFLFLVYPLIWLCGLFFERLFENIKICKKCFIIIGILTFCLICLVRIYREKEHHSWIKAGIDFIRREPSHYKKKAIISSAARAKQLAYYADAVLIGTEVNTFSWDFVQSQLEMYSCSDFQIYIPFYIHSKEEKAYPEIKIFPQGICRRVLRIDQCSRKHNKIFLLYLFDPDRKPVYDRGGVSDLFPLRSMLPRNGDFEASDNVNSSIPYWQIGGGGFNEHTARSIVALSKTRVLSGKQSLIIAGKPMASVFSNTFCRPLKKDFLVWKVQGIPGTRYSIQLYERSSGLKHFRRFLFQGYIQNTESINYVVPVDFRKEEQNIQIAIQVYRGEIVIDDIFYIEKI